MSANRVKDWRSYWVIKSPATGKILIPQDKGWEFNGDFERPTFSPSVLETSVRHDPSMNWCNHVYIRDGKIEYLVDCTHDMAGQTVEIPLWDDEEDDKTL